MSDPRPKVNILKRRIKTKRRKKAGLIPTSEIVQIMSQQGRENGDETETAENDEGDRRRHRRRQRRIEPGRFGPQVKWTKKKSTAKPSMTPGKKDTRRRESPAP